MRWLKDLILRRRKVADMIEEELYETKIKLLEFEKAVEHDTHMLRMYQERYARLISKEQK